MCPYLPDLFVCVSQIFAELNRLVIESNYQRPSPRKQGRQLGKEWFIYRENWKWRKKGEKWKRTTMKMRLRVQCPHIWLYKLSIWVKDFWWLCKLQTHQMYNNPSNSGFAIASMPWHLKREKVSSVFGNRALFTFYCRCCIERLAVKFTAESSSFNSTLTFERKCFFLASI